MPKAFLIDTSLCTACRGCQLACKEWHELPANQTKQQGTHQNPPDLNAYNYKIVRFTDYLDESGTVRWNFFPDQCRHCVYPPCKDMADSIQEGVIVKDEAPGAVLFTEKRKDVTADDFDIIRNSCPYDIPRRDEKTGLMAKCTMCHNRVASGMLPACVKTCPTSAMNFGERGDILAMAQKRLAEVRKTFPKAMLADADSVSVIFLLTDAPERFHGRAVAMAPGLRARKEFLAQLASPFRQVLNSLGRRA